jgi:hypothetical protein
MPDARGRLGSQGGAGTDEDSWGTSQITLR